MSIQEIWQAKPGCPSTTWGKRVRLSSAASGRESTEAWIASASHSRRAITSSARALTAVVSVERSITA